MPDGDGELFQQSTASLTFTNFLEKMRDPSCTDLVRSIKGFINSTIDLPSPRNPDEDGQRVQTFMRDSEKSLRSHSMWTGCSEEELEAAGEGLEKYLMTKLHQVTFGIDEAERERDAHLSAKMAALKQFLQPEHLEIPEQYRDTEVWVLAQKNLLQMNNYKSPRDKIVCVLNACQVIYNHLEVASAAGGAPGADAFLPVLIYVTIQANPPGLESNLKYIERYRGETRLVSEAAYFFTNLVSAASFVETMDATTCAPHLDPELFLRHMRAASLLPAEVDPEAAVASPAMAEEPPMLSPAPAEWEPVPSSTAAPAPGAAAGEPAAASPAMPPPAVVPPPAALVDAPVAGAGGSGAGAGGGVGAGVSLEELEARGRGAAAAAVDGAGPAMLEKYEFLSVDDAGDLRLADVPRLLAAYKALATKCEAVRAGLEGWGQGAGGGGGAAGGDASPRPRGGGGDGGQEVWEGGGGSLI